LRATGVALWENSKAPSRVWLFKMASDMREENFLIRAREQAKKVFQLCIAYRVTRVYIEFPIFFASSARGHMVAASGDLLKLCATVGAIGAQVPSFAQLHPVKVPDWKGQLPKPVVNRRIEAILGKGFCKTMNFEADIWDAVGIGLWALGRF
jgi:hypothetical protein